MSSPPPELVIRPLVHTDREFLVEMLYAAAFWRPRPRGWRGIVPRLANWAKRIVLRDYLALYYEEWGRPGDVGLVAEIRGRRAGAAWYRMFTEGRHGDGFVDEETPELSIAVIPGSRGRGIGRALLERLEAEARAAGLAQVALSVNADNPAKRLYVRCGYRDLASSDPKERMVLTLS